MGPVALSAKPRTSVSDTPCLTSAGTGSPGLHVKASAGCTASCTQSCPLATLALQGFYSSGEKGLLVAVIQKSSKGGADNHASLLLAAVQQQLKNPTVESVQSRSS